MVTRVGFANKVPADANKMEILAAFIKLDACPADTFTVEWVEFLGAIGAGWTTCAVRVHAIAGTHCGVSTRVVVTCPLSTYQPRRTRHTSPKSFALAYSIAPQRLNTTPINHAVSTIATGEFTLSVDTLAIAIAAHDGIAA